MVEWGDDVTRKQKGVVSLRQRAWLFVVPSRLGYTVRTTRGYWALITAVKHPTLLGQERVVIETLTNPDQVRVSKTDASVFLFYRKMGRKFLCVVTKRATPAVGFVMTAYFTDKVKEGQLAWKR